MLLQCRNEVKPRWRWQGNIPTESFLAALQHGCGKSSKGERCFVPACQKGQIHPDMTRSGMVCFTMGPKKFQKLASELADPDVQRCRWKTCSQVAVWSSCISLSPEIHVTHDTHDGSVFLHLAVEHLTCRWTKTGMETQVMARQAIPWFKTHAKWHLVRQCSPEERRGGVLCFGGRASEWIFWGEWFVFLGVTLPATINICVYTQLEMYDWRQGHKNPGNHILLCSSRAKRTPAREKAVLYKWLMNQWFPSIRL